MKIVKVLLSVFMALFSLAALVFGSVHFFLRSRTAYEVVLKNDEYANAVIALVHSDLTQECAFMDIPYDRVISGLGGQEWFHNEIRARCEENIRVLSAALVSGKKASETAFPSPYFQKSIQAYLDEFSAENQMELEPGLAAEMSARLSEITGDGIQSVSSYISRLSVYNFMPLVRPAPVLAGVSLVLLILCGVLLFVVNRSAGAFSSLYALFAALWFGVTPVFVPAAVVAALKYPSRLAIADSPLRSYLVSTLDHALGNVLLLSAICFTAATIGLIVCTVLNVRGGALAGMKKQARRIIQ